MVVQWLVWLTSNRKVLGLATAHLLAEFSALELSSVREVRKRIQSGVKIASYFYFFTQSQLIEPVLPQAAQQGLFVIAFITLSLRCSSLRDLIKDTK